MDEWISHPKFGQGRVTEVRNGKVTVRFPEPDTRILDMPILIAGVVLWWAAHLFKRAAPVQRAAA